jgi:type II secretory pathway component PulF
MLGIFLDRDRKQSRRLLLHLLYPLIVFMSAVCLLVYLAIAVIPQFALFYSEFHVEMPPIMGTLLIVSNVVRNPIALLITTAWALVAMYFLFVAIQSEKGSLLFDHFRLRVPVIGELLYKSLTVRFCYVMSMLIQSSINNVTALDIAIPVVNSPAFAVGLVKARNALKLGTCESLSDALDSTALFEGLLIGAIRVGEQTGDVPDMLTSVAADYSDDIDAIITILPNVVQTLLTLFVACIVFLIAYAIYVPMTTLLTHIGSS